MNINGLTNMSSIVSFKGIVPPYTLKNGTKVTPISQDPAIDDINSAIKATKKTSDNPMEGLNGHAFQLGEDLIVKRYKGEKAINNDPQREINLLDKMFMNNLKFKNSQTGCYAFETPDGQVYMVSTKVEGKNPNALNGAEFTKENLQSLSEIILQMDKGSIIPNSSNHGYSDRCRFMNYDFNGGNIKVTADKAGLFDFEYDKFENIDEIISNALQYGVHGYNCNQSDTSALPSCIRSFEYWTFCDYLKDADNASDLFNDYLEIKGNYHAQMSKFFSDFSQESAFPEEVMNISKKEAVHSRLLQKDSNGRIPEDILKAEAKKIQMANFLHEQGIFNSTGIINPKQMADYTAETINYYTECLELAENNGDTDRITYFTNCLDLVSQWGTANKDLQRRIEEKDPSALKKITNGHIKTLDDVLNL